MRLEMRVPPREMKILDAYCAETRRTRADVLREYIRTLERKLPKRS